MKRFFSYYKPYRKILIIDLLCAAIIALCAVSFPLFVRYITKDILENNLSNASTLIIHTGIYMIILVIIWYAAMYFVGYYGHVMGVKMESDLRSDLFAAYQRLSFSFYDNQKTGQLMSRLTNDLLSLTELYHHGPEDIFIYSIRFIGGLIVLFMIDVKLTLLLMLFLPFLLLYAYYSSKKMKVALKVNKERIADINASVEDNLSGIRVVKSFTNEEYEVKKFEKQNQRFLKSRKIGYKSETDFYEGLGFLTQIMTVVVIIFAAINIVNQNMDIADLITFMMYIGFFVEPINKISHLSGQWHEGFASFERFMEIIEIKPEIVDKEEAIAIDEINGSISFENVSFKYEENQDYVLENINLDIHEGDFIALVGVSGVGKSTLCSLISRFYDVDTGSIKIDNIDIRDIKLETVRKNIGIVAQDIYLFDGTIIENIGYGNLEASYDEIVAAAKKANAHDFIMSLPDGYNTLVGQRGIKLSGGQKQRISIARVFLKNPPILIFDEATSSLDNESEKIVQESLESLSSLRTTLVIAHRLSTIRNAKRIIVLENKSIVEQGSHEELMKQDGVYRKLYEISSKI